MKILLRKYFQFSGYLEVGKHALLLLLRGYWGILFVQTGWGKLSNPERVGEFFASLGLPIPGVMAYVVGAGEFFGGILLFSGLFSRLSASWLTALMVGAFASAHREELAAIISTPSEFYSAAPFTFLLISAIVMIFGAGKVSLDFLIERRFPKSHECALCDFFEGSMPMGDADERVAAARK